MRNLILGAVLAVGLLACGAAAHDYATQDDIDDLQAQIVALRYRAATLELAVFPPDATFDDGRPPR